MANPSLPPLGPTQRPVSPPAQPFRADPGEAVISDDQGVRLTRREAERLARQAIGLIEDAARRQGGESVPDQITVSGHDARLAPRDRLSQLLDAADLVQRLKDTLDFLAHNVLGIADLARFADGLKGKAEAVLDPSADPAQLVASGRAGVAGRAFLVFEDVEIAARADGTGAAVGARHVAIRAELAFAGDDRGRPVFRIAAVSAQQRDGAARVPAQGDRAAAQSLLVQTRLKFQIEYAVRRDPLILDLAGNGIATTGLADGHDFDLDADGRADRTAWVKGDDALLALDRNGNGRIDDGTELFGTQSGDGFRDLRQLDDNGDGAIDVQDSAFKSLVLLHADGSQASLAADGVRRIRLDLIVPVQLRLYGGMQAAQGQFERADGSAGRVAEVLLDVQV
jgi:hypothetical protein